MILDGTYPECALGIVHSFKVPFMYINTVGFYAMPQSNSGSPAPFSVTPFFGKGFTDNMGFIDRTLNAAWHVGEYANNFIFKTSTLYSNFTCTFLYHSLNATKTNEKIEAHCWEAILGRSISLLFTLGNN